MAPSVFGIISEKISILKPGEKETPDVAGKLVCAAAGIETDECVEAVKTENEEINSDESSRIEKILLEEIKND